MRGNGVNCSRRRDERGQTIFLVAVSLVALLAMAALAIDVVTLFVARAEVQRAADAAALAGAKAIADSGATTDAAYIPLAQNMAGLAISGGAGNGVLQQNLVAGRVPQVVGTPTFDFVTHGNSNPTITVTIQQTNLPTFFARIWNRALATVSATATAEAYNPSGSQTALGHTVPIAPKCVKPWLMANKDPNNGGSPFINASTGAVLASNVPQANPFALIYVCPVDAACVPVSLGAGQILPGVVVGNVTGVPSCATGGSNYEQAIAGCDSTAYACGGSTWNATIDTVNLDLGLVQNSLQCLMHADANGPGRGQDEIDYSGLPSNPIQLKAGSNNPLIGSGSPVVAGSVITTSSSIVTIPIIDDTIAGNQVRVIGFMQGFLTQVMNLGGALGVSVSSIKPLNLSGCGNNVVVPPSGPVSGGGVSPIPVRLVHQ